MENCPYCGNEVEINHDDGYGYDEGELYEQTCEHCDKTFTYYTHISFDYNLYQADCLNGLSDHNWKRSRTYPRMSSTMACSTCGSVRSLTESEWEELIHSFDKFEWELVEQYPMNFKKFLDMRNRLL